MKWRLAAALLAAAPLAAQGFTAELWKSAEPVYSKTLDHPFLKGLSRGTLPGEKFRYYLMQDLLYLRGFSKALLELASKAPDPKWAQTLSRHANEAIGEERTLHLSLVEALEVGGERRFSAVMSPTNAAYTNHLLVSAHRGSFAEGMAAVLPCYWIYLKVGRQLVKNGSPGGVYGRWISQYASPAYAKSVGEALAIMDEAARTASEREKKNALLLFERSARYEYMFWDMAWRMERWPPE